MLACARILSPEGGPIDTEPPRALSFDPPLYQRYFQEHSFTVVFDEYVTVQDFGNQVVISPPLDVLPEYKLKGKTLTVSWLDTLEANTTYQFNFGEAIKDVNEGNAARNLIYVFSTGSTIDSLMVSGRVLEARSNAPPGRAFAMLYKGDADSLPYSVKPDYFAVCDTLGYFHIPYLPAEDFKLFVLREEVANYLYSGPPESIAFTETAIASRDSSYRFDVLLPLFTETDTVQYLLATASTDYGYYQVVFNTPASAPGISFYDAETDELLEAVSLLSTSRDTLRSWVNFPDREDFEEVRVVTHTERMEADTSTWYIEQRKQYLDEAQLQLQTNLSQNKLGRYDALVVQFNNPIALVDTSLVQLMEDSIPVALGALTLSDLNLQMRIDYPFNATSQYQFSADAGAFRDMFGSYSDSLQVAFSLRESSYYGSIAVSVFIDNVSDKNIPKLLQLLSASGAVLEERKFYTGLTERFEQLAPGTYSLAVIYDRNDNGEWDTGNYMLGIQPERYSSYAEKINVRSNWEFEVEWEPYTPFDKP